MTLNDHYQDWLQEKCSDEQMALAFFIHCHLKKYPNRKLEAQLMQEDVDLKVVFKQFVFKKVKSKALHALKAWVDGLWQFKLITKIISPYEVLRLQAQGIRPVTMKIQDELSPILHKEDSLEFFLHDLEHGYMFFFDKELKIMQLDFFRKVEQSIAENWWSDYLGDKEFEERFHYLISDMNTHQEHYRAYLNSLVKEQDIPKFSKLFES